MQRINLIPPEFAIGEKALIETGLRRQAILLGILLAVALVVHYGMNRTASLVLEQEVNALERQLYEATVLSEALAKNKEAIQVQMENLEKRMNVLMGRQMLLERFGSDQFKWSEALAYFHRSIPSKVWVDELVLDEPTSQVKGGTFSNELVSAFIDGLNRSAYFANATFVKTEAGVINEQSVVNYELNFELVKKQKA